MKVTNGEIYLAPEPLSKLMESKLPVRVSYQIAKLAHEINDKRKPIEETRISLVKKWGKPDEKGNTNIPPDSEAYANFVKDFLVVLEEQVELTSIKDKICLPEKVTGTCDKCNHNMDKMFEIEPKTLLALDAFITVI